MARAITWAAVTGAWLALATAGFAADAALIEAAKKEGRVTWYTTLIIDQFSRPAAQAFEKKYGVKVDYVRADPVDIVLRIYNEAKAGRTQADVYDGTATAPGLKKEGLALKWLPESAQRLPKHYIDPEGYWTTSNLYVMVPGFNTELIKKGTEPRTYDDLLDPKWKGKMSWSRSPAASAGPGVVGLILKERGEEKGLAYLRELAKQSLSSIDGSARQLLDQIMAGEYPMGLGLFNHQFVISAAKGAPIEWIPMEPAMVALSTIGVTKDAPHPNAGKLLTDFLVSSEGQAFFRDANYVSADPATPPLEPRLVPDVGKFRAQYFTPEEIQDNMPKWVGIYKEIFR